MKIFICFFAIFFMTISLYSQSEPMDTDGNGYRNISTLNHLRWVSENKSCWGDKFELDNDINAKKTKRWNDSKGWSPIGTKNKPFTDVFDGKGHSITKLTIDRIHTDEVGFFGFVQGGNAQILNLSLLKCDITGEQHIAGFAVNVSGATITNCKVTGTIESTFSLSGFIVYADSSIITKCSSNCKMRSWIVSGFIAVAESSNIQYCSTQNEIKFSYGASGFMLRATNSKVSKCSSNGSLLYKPRFWGLLEDDQNTPKTATGFIGNNESNSEIEDCFSTCNIKTMGCISGFLDANAGKIAHCYSTGLLKNKSEKVECIVGFSHGKPYNNSGSVDDSFWDKETSQTDSSDGGRGKTIAEMKTKSTYTDVGWDFDTIWDIKPEINNGYPYLRNVDNY